MYNFSYKERCKMKQFIEKLSRDTGISVKELNRLNNNKWYHGTTLEGSQSIQSGTVFANYNIGTELDFGAGFYLTDTYERAETYISRVPMTDEDGYTRPRTEWAVIEFELNPFELLFRQENSYTYKNFPKHNEEFAKFSFENRLNNVYNEKPHGYDIIWGVMSDSFPIQILLDYKNGTITYEDAIMQMQKPNSMKQLYIGNQAICDMLKITDIKVVKKEETHYE